MDIWTDVQAIIADTNRKKLGYIDTLDIDSLISSELNVQIAGGGYFIKRRNVNQITNIHLFPHGSTKIPIWCKGYFLTADHTEVAQAVLENCDTPTTAIASSLIEHMKIDESDSSMIAYFDVSRIIIDANRLTKCEQTSGDALVGKPIFDIGSDETINERLRDNLLQPWIHGVNSTIRQNNCRIVVHHHSYDVHGKKPLSNDLNPLRPRPLAQFLYKKPYWVGEPSKGQFSYDSNRGFIKEPILNEIIAVSQRYLSQIIKDPDIRIDFPYIAPLLPFVGCVENKCDAVEIEHILYEIRKDVLDSVEKLSIWIECIHDIVDVTRTFYDYT